MFLLKQNKAPFCQQLIKLMRMNNEHMQIAWQFLTEATVKKTSIFGMQ